ncbi:RloB family protein [Algoriphagus formosus]|uniref:RloB domain-containing protein n=1 Tax=Algoriphagus formosus TaxID=2007308 RepID=A0A4R5V7K3_9BACT|nr:RloB family protein [Algoriphagus aquimaris]TDK47914.1 RloB domain-containing protein [Algoriphagus aquimaris]
MSMLLSRNRLFERRPPSRDAKIIYIFCEGRDREYWYFQYFREMDSRIHLEIHLLDPHEDNSPLGLKQIAENALIASEDNPHPKFAIQEDDEVWIVLDTDPDEANTRDPQIKAIRSEVERRDNWNLAQSNPCFEVWLYFHGKEEIEEFDSMELSKSWKTILNEIFKGGFDLRKHPIFIEDASLRAASKFELGEDGCPQIGSTEVYRLAESILALLGEKIREVREKLP